MSDNTPDAVEKYGITKSLYTALWKPSDRMFCLRLERDLLQFIESKTDSYKLQAMNSYYRLLAHQVADYYKLGHSISSDALAILVFKQTPSDDKQDYVWAAKNRARLSKIEKPQEDVAMPYATPAHLVGTPKLARKGTPKIASKGSLSSPPNPEPTKSTGSLPDLPLENELAAREERYQKARERIFQSGSEDEKEEEVHDSPPAPRPVVSDVRSRPQQGYTSPIYSQAPAYPPFYRPIPGYAQPYPYYPMMPYRNEPFMPPVQFSPSNYAYPPTAPIESNPYLIMPDRVKGHKTNRRKPRE
ncbi:hypothetical protein BABINDRAFT_162733 [Babjeviella inositovora NRRL Y-12698]|uniref:R3H domain-containing protein n=1 Tax=Babjeviella inositovora NRRL Y-12698 TaxID=984486 RepID=A0A1E3QNF9_9ASCO|nr:uncharacterized protein BABINDRAFT_162733 [Babjeviella inositovora NRRL Y-12698]ODQ78527.1 hypothetical protein BABINDRAFT_162733 [Babjeviella inositovora NRRL Y-12698]